MKKFMCALAVALASVGGSAAAVTIDFETLASTTTVDAPSPYSEDGFTLTGAAFFGNFAAIGSSETSLYTGSTALYNPNVGSMTTSGISIAA